MYCQAIFIRNLRHPEHELPSMGIAFRPVVGVDEQATYVAGTKFVHVVVNPRLDGVRQQVACFVVIAERNE